MDKNETIQHLHPEGPGGWLMDKFSKENSLPVHDASGKLQGTYSYSEDRGY